MTIPLEKVCAFYLRYNVPLDEEILSKKRTLMCLHIQL